MPRACSYAPARAPLWADDGLRRAAGDTLRPGGLPLTERALALAGLRPGQRILDLGCGLGATVAHLASLGYRAVGLDATPAQLAKRRRRDLPLAAARAEALPLRPGRFHGTLCECVLSLLDDPGQALAGLARVLVPGGMLVVTDLCRDPGRSGHDKAAPLPPGCARKALNQDRFTDLARNAGFLPLILERHDRLLAELAARLILADVWRPGAETGFRPVPRLGYFLFIARRTGDDL